VLELAHRRHRDALDRAAIARVEFVDERLDEQRQIVLATAAAARNRKDIEAIKRSSRSLPSRIATTGSMLVAASTRTSTSCSVRPPRRRTSAPAAPAAA
jgi:hypothetical protein